PNVRKKRRSRPRPPPNRRLCRRRSELRTKTKRRAANRRPFCFCHATISVILRCPRAARAPKDASVGPRPSRVPFARTSGRPRAAPGLLMTTAKHIKIFSGGAMRPLLHELVPLFERAHGVTAEVEFRLSAAVKRAIEDGALFHRDLAAAGARRPDRVGCDRAR